MSQESSSTSSRIYVKVPYEEKDDVKALGGYWDMGKKLWYCNESTSIDNIININSRWSLLKRTRLKVKVLNLMVS